MHMCFAQPRRVSVAKVCERLPAAVIMPWPTTVPNLRLTRIPPAPSSLPPSPLPLQAFSDLSNDSASLRAAGVAHGDMLYMLYSIERQVEPAYRKSVFECEPRGRGGTGVPQVRF